jgi:hypothetical protein
LQLNLNSKSQRGFKSLDLVIPKQHKMKKIFLLLISASFIFACNNEPATTETASSDTTATNETLNLPYAVDRTPDWEIGDNSNVTIAMNTLKGFEQNDMAAVAQHLADSVEFYADGVAFKGTKDSLIQMMSKYRSSYDTIMIKMRDYESVKSKNRGEEWVGLWYTETVTPKGGKTDSAMTMDDIKIVDGKVALIDSKMRRLVAK